ncbi:MAG: hypothetical protein LAO55_05865 [Acidobacteriia bacterium]|nr:hypothetical protein [Terriglobia bacterium]
MRTLAAIVLLLAVFGASTRCVADCLTHQNVPPCHQHSKGKNSGPESCKLAQPVADFHATYPPSVEPPAPAEIAFELFASETPSPDSAQLSFTILRL